MSQKENKPKNLTGRIAALVREAVEDCGCRLWDVEFVKEGSDHTLIIYIDKDGGISLTDCQMVNDAVDPLLEAEDPIEGSYFLEISSPGIERELKTAEHFAAFQGSDVQIKLYAPKDGRKTVTGKLRSFDGEKDLLTLEGDSGETIELTRKECAKIQTICDF